MKNVSDQGKRKNKRRNRHSGQAIAEGAAIGIFLTILGIGLLLLLYNTFVVTTYSHKLQVVAEEVARSIGESQYWLGMQRQQGPKAFQFDYAAACDKATITGDAMLRTMGLLSKHGAAKWSIPSAPTPVDPSNPAYGSIITVTVTVENLPLFTGGNHYIPSVITLSSTGVSASSAAPPGGMAILNFYDPTLPSGHNHKSIRVPIYCANKEVIPTYTSNPPPPPYVTGHNASGFLQAGVWQGEFPVAFVGDVKAALAPANSFIETEKYAAGAPLPKSTPSVGGAANEVPTSQHLIW